MHFALSIWRSSDAKRFLLVGFDEYSADEPHRIKNDMICQANIDLGSNVIMLEVSQIVYNTQSKSICAL